MNRGGFRRLRRAPRRRFWNFHLRRVKICLIHYWNDKPGSIRQFRFYLLGVRPAAGAIHPWERRSHTSLTINKIVPPPPMGAPSAVQELTHDSWDYLSRNCGENFSPNYKMSGQFDNSGPIPSGFAQRQGRQPPGASVFSLSGISTGGFAGLPEINHQRCF